MAYTGSHVADDHPQQRLAHQTRVTDHTRSSSLVDLTATGARLVPKQLKDEITIALNSIKGSGVKLGLGVGLAVVGLFFFFVMVVALIVALIGAFADTNNMWFWALMIAAAGLVLGLVSVGIGALVIKAQMPLVPPESVRGFKHDLGYLTEGSDFDPVEFDRLEAEKAERKEQQELREKELQKQATKEEKLARKRGEAPTTITSVKPSAEELRQRVALRRRHLGDIRSGLEEKADFKAQFSSFTAAATGRHRAGEDGASPVSSYSGAARAGEKVNDAGEYMKDRWQPLALFGASSTALAMFLKKLTSKK